MKFCSGKSSLMFLGTGADDWPKEIPLDSAKKHYRHESSLLIDRHVLVDCGSTVAGALEKLEVDVSNITDILITHTHRDHFSNLTLQKIVDSIQNNSADTVKLWMNPFAAEKVEKIDGIELMPVMIGDTFKIGGYEVSALPANHKVHDSKEEAMHFLFENEAQSFLYALDGGWFTVDTWEMLTKKQLDAIIWDATIGNVEDDWRIFSHNSLSMIRLMMKSLHAKGICRPGCKHLLTHIAKYSFIDIKEALEQQQDNNMVLLYDGMHFDF